MRAALILLLIACTPAVSGDCVTLATTAPDSIDSRLAYYDQGCATDDDCVLISAQVSCFKSCPAAVLKTSMTDALNDVAGHDSDICMGLSCNIQVGCNPSHAVCAKGECRAVEGEPDAGTPDSGVPDAGSSDAGP
jgi:hypothetical protein